tara:strand:+ start:2251 stop:3135 length:885 start_codon:yes stop_codon:yes gene_type:complete
MTDLNNRRTGLLFGSFSAEALSLGVHWIYDPDELARKHGRVTHYQAPGSDSYHPHKQSGDQGHVGDQALRLLGFLKREQRWGAATFMDDWLAMWASYDDYVDKATKTTLTNVQSGATPTDAGSASDELAGPARIAPLVAFLAESPEHEVVQAAVEQTKLTHRSPDAEEAATFLAKASFRIMHGASLEDTIRETAPDWALKAADGVLALPAEEAIGELGRACPIPSALPSVIYLALKHGGDTETAFIENAMTGGDNCARALALGMLLGAANGIDSIPERWRSELSAASDLHALLS